MIIKTKFNLGDKVYGISYTHKLVEFEVAKIEANVKDEEIEISYYPSDGKSGYMFLSFNERYCFASSSDAVEYIKDA